MASTNQTSWTNMTIDLLRNNPHVDCKPFLKQLAPKTINSGIRFVSQQSRVTEGKWSVRLDAWYYIRRVSQDDVLKALSDLGFSSPSLRIQIQSCMENQQFYHVAIRGNDPSFMPLGAEDGQDLVTTYCCERVDLIFEEVDKYLFDELDDPQAIQQAMSDPLFDQMLEQYFLRGDTKQEETLHVVSRFRGGNNLLHSCIKEGYLESLRLLLDRYTLESHGSAARWRVLAEPLRPCGAYKITAFHRAVYDGQPQCLEELILWAQGHNHKITELRNVEERSFSGETLKALTCLELAEQENNLACYNVLAPIFGVPPKHIAIDANPRNARLALRMIPRVELTTDPEVEPLQTIELTDLDWCAVLAATKALRIRDAYKANDLGHLTLTIHNVAFLSDATEQQLDELLAETDGMLAVAAQSCFMKSDKTALHCLRVVVDRFLSGSEGHLPDRMPKKVHLSSPVSDEVTSEEQELIDAEVGRLQAKFTDECGKWPGFLGAHNGLISAKQRQRLALSGNCAFHAASLAASYATRVPAFLHHASAQTVSELESWIGKRRLMPLARAVFKNFFDPDKLLMNEFHDPGHALDPGVVLFLKMTLLAWFATVPRDGRKDAWQAWADRLASDEEVVKMQLAPALDLVLDSLLRMWKALDPVCQHPRASTAGVHSIHHLVKHCVPETLLTRLPKTQSRLRKHSELGQSQAPPSQRSRVSLLTSPLSLRPGGGQLPQQGKTRG